MVIKEFDIQHVAISEIRKSNDMDLKFKDQQFSRLTFERWRNEKKITSGHEDDDDAEAEQKNVNLL